MFVHAQAQRAQEEKKGFQDLMDTMVRLGLKVVLVHQAGLEDQDLLGPRELKVFPVHGDTLETLEIRYAIDLI